jgi:serine/threonine-protein kinase RsbW
MDDYILKISESYKSEKKSIKYVEPLINSVKEKIPISLEKYYNILIAVTEAFNNAIIHGNKLDSNKKVGIEITANDKVIEVIITDEGKGFNPDELADPREPDNLLKDNGRGVLLIKELTDTCDFNHTDKGTVVFMSFFIDENKGIEE